MRDFLNVTNGFLMLRSAPLETPLAEVPHDKGARLEARTTPEAAIAKDTVWGECAAILRHDFASFAARSFRELNPRTPFAANWHFDLVAAKLAAVRAGHIRRLIVSLPPRHLKSHLASIAFPAWCLGHDPSASILCVSYAQDLADKLSRDCRRILASDWYQRLFPTRLAPKHQAVPNSRRPHRARASPPRSAGC
jgi:hypothetical protein